MMQTATATKPPKVYVAVKADFAADGTMFPRIITWEDGEKYEIDRVSDISADLTGNNIGRWFVERRQ